MTRLPGPAVTGELSLNFLEADFATADRVRAAYSAEDWARLVALKDRYDPRNRFRFNRNIAPVALIRPSRRPGTLPVVSWDTALLPAAVRLSEAPR